MTDPTHDRASSSEASTDRWPAVRELLEGRMAELGVTQADVVRTSGVSPITLRALMAGERTRYRSSSLRSVSRALRWEPLSLERFITSGDLPIDWIDRAVVVRELQEISRAMDTPISATVEERLQRVEDKLDRVLTILEAGH